MWHLKNIIKHKLVAAQIILYPYMDSAWKSSNVLTNLPAICKIASSYHSAALTWSPTEAKQGWTWSVPGWETSWEN